MTLFLFLLRILSQLEKLRILETQISVNKIYGNNFFIEFLYLSSFFKSLVYLIKVQSVLEIRNLPGVKQQCRAAE